jgi:hypothetical protein
LREHVSSSDAYPAHRERGVVEVQATLSGLDPCRAPGAVTLLKARGDVRARVEMLECSEYLFVRGRPLWWHELIEEDAARWR